MVSKLLLAAQESCLAAIKENADAATVSQLIAHYYNIQAGIGVHKSPELYGAFPITPYSHTPFNKGAQQPGMTGQVKEDILCRIGELGVKIKDGQLLFEPSLLSKNEFIQQPRYADFVLSNGTEKNIELSAGSLAFSICQVPVVCKTSNANSIEVLFANGTKEQFNANTISAAVSNKIINRTGEVEEIIVHINETNLL
jgi:hypothetical protein